MEGRGRGSIVQSEREREGDGKSAECNTAAASSIGCLSQHNVYADADCRADVVNNRGAAYLVCVKKMNVHTRGRVEDR